MNEDSPETPGAKTTEFWMTAAGVITAFLVSLHIVPAADAQNVTAWIAAAATHIIALVALAGMVVKYVHGRQVSKGHALPHNAPASLLVPVGNVPADTKS